MNPEPSSPIDPSLRPSGGQVASVPTPSGSASANSARSAKTAPHLPRRILRSFRRGFGRLAGARDSKRRRRLRVAAPLLLVLLGVLVLLYPVIATQHNNADQQRLASMYSARLESMGPDVLTQKISAAEAYNEHLEASPILDPWLDSQRPDTPRYQEYLSQLDLDEVMGRVTIPSIHADLPIYHGTQPSTLAKGIGHLFGTSLPVGGTSTHSVLTGHTGLGTATIFDNLVDVKQGDAFYVAVAGRTLKYQVVNIQVVLPTETNSLNEVAGRDLITLITCTPYGVNSHRLLVTGERVPMDPAAAAQDASKALPAPMQTWQIAIIWVVVGVLLVVAAVLIWAFLAARRRRRKQVAETGPQGDGGGGDGGLDPRPGPPGSPLNGGALENREEIVRLEELGDAGPPPNIVKHDREVTAIRT
ncbi:Sortase (surface protein transpeptidase) [Actinomyces bovis]|uniref:Sortase (Surface protein transpeptidase) n=1 Tax=Actinomyces bovis TaxID=1658 RepID=A0ABY1VML5_9ACTO|nr:class C sortase [Actinomyces bovis]SPT52926.1 Sortase (surface protein transpeptidase) [Actinomyces bovis]VEG55091.1 Sortase (surface protein transpeptidase) [Actinomyces israelii]